MSLSLHVAEILAQAPTATPLPIGNGVEGKVKGIMVTVFGIVVAAAAIGIGMANRRAKTSEVGHRVGILGVAGILLAISGAIVGIGYAMANGIGLPTS
jgi:hypothetical protein